MTIIIGCAERGEAFVEKYCLNEKQIFMLVKHIG